MLIFCSKIGLSCTLLTQKDLFYTSHCYSFKFFYLFLLFTSWGLINKPDKKDFVYLLITGQVKIKVNWTE